MAYFYSHIIEIETVVVGLDELDMHDTHKKHIASLIDSTIHHTVMDVVMSKLSDEDKKIFVERMKKHPHDPELMEFLNSRVDGIEDEIKAAVKELKEELHQDLKEAKHK